MAIFKTLCIIVLTVLGILGVYTVTLFVLVCYGEKKEVARRQEEHSQKYGDIPNSLPGWFWMPEYAEEFKRMKEKVDEATERSKR